MARQCRSKATSSAPTSVDSTRSAPERVIASMTGSKSLVPSGTKRSPTTIPCACGSTCLAARWAPCDHE